MTNVSIVSSKIKPSFRKEKVIAPLHTTGPFAVTSDGRRTVTCVGEETLLVDVESSTEICRFKGDGTSITAVAVTPSGRSLAVFYTSLFLRIYELPEQPTTTPVPWTRQVSKAHEAPVHVACIDETSTLLASGAADGVVKVWDLQRGYITHSFRGHGGVVSALTFHRKLRDGSSTTTQLFTASVDTRVRIFDLDAAASRAAGAKPRAVLEGHVSVPRGLAVSRDGKWLISGGRDSVVLIWDLEAQKKQPRTKASQTPPTITLEKTIPVLERVEAVGVVDADALSISGGQELLFFTAGEKGVVRVWDAWSGKIVSEVSATRAAGEDNKEQHEIVNAFYLRSHSSVVTLQSNQNIQFFSLIDSTLSRQIIGFNDEIIDASFLSPDVRTKDSHIALATNSSLIRVYSTKTLDARLVDGHSDMVLCLSSVLDGQMLLSGSKDKTARLWTMSPTGDWYCLAICEGHAESVGAVAASRQQSTTDGKLRFVVTGSQDRTVKMWDMTPVSFPGEGNLPERAKSLLTMKVHEKDINSLDISPNDRWLASGSQDRTAKIFEIEYSWTTSGTKAKLKHVGTLKGHKRGVWDVRFSPSDRVIATASGDKTVKLWNLGDYSCLKTFEGHTNSILRVAFMNQGSNLVTSASDGLVKIWTIRDEECVLSLDNHEDKVWALAISSDEQTIVSGAADSMVTFWKDCTTEIDSENEIKRTELVLKEQDLVNYLSLKDYRNAILLALSMGQPGRLFNMFESIRNSHASPTSITGNESVDTVIKTLPLLELARLLRYIRNWNASSRSYSVAQSTLHAILKLRPAEDIIAGFATSSKNLLAQGSLVDDQGGGSVKEPEALKDVLDGLMPYTARHFARADRMVQDSFIVDYILGEMDAGLLVGGVDGMVLDS